MPLIGQRERAQIKEWFERSLSHDLSIIHFTHHTYHEPLLVIPGGERHYYREICDLLKEVASLSQKIRLEIYDFDAEPEAAEAYHIDKIPATVLMGSKDYGVRYFGIPSGYEFSTLIQAIIDVSKGSGGLSQETREQLEEVNQEVHIQVFVTPW